MTEQLNETEKAVEAVARGWFESALWPGAWAKAHEVEKGEAKRHAANVIKALQSLGWRSPDRKETGTGCLQCDSGDEPCFTGYKRDATEKRFLHIVKVGRKYESIPCTRKAAP